MWRGGSMYVNDEGLMNSGYKPNLLALLLLHRSDPESYPIGTIVVGPVVLLGPPDRNGRETDLHWGYISQLWPHLPVQFGGTIQVGG
jgi:hypothetical protein